MNEYKWQELTLKDKILYIVSISLFFSGMIIPFLSLLWNNLIENGCLIYSALAFLAACTVFGIRIHAKTNLGEFSTDSNNEKDNGNNGTNK